MSNITIYLDDTLEARLRQTAHKEGLSISKLVAKFVEEKTAEAWSSDFMALAGSWKDIQRPVHSDDAKREIL